MQCTHVYQYSSNMPHLFQNLWTKCNIRQREME
uniref:Uncharacterized protein n=1 Tax=Anguilla anguilla TaxID=7936 RepID=A0A0E9Q546_ANGAN